MGNFFSSSSSCSNSINDIKLSNYDMAIYNDKKKKVFWGTIAICIIYTIIALIMFFGSYTSNTFKNVLLNRFYVFTIIFIIGTIMIVAYLYYQVYNFKPIKINRANKYEVLSCPDYWRLEKVNITDNNSNAFDSNISKQLFSYRCVMDSKIFNKTDVAKNLIVKGDPSPYQLRVTDISPTDDLITNENINLNDYGNSLYAPSSNVMVSSNLLKYAKNNNYAPGLLLHHNMIMNNYSYDMQNSTKPYEFTADPDNANILYKYNITNANPNQYENDLNVYNLKYKKDNSVNAMFNAAESPFVNLNINKADGTLKTYQFSTGSTAANAKAGTTGAVAGTRVTPTNPLNRVPIVCDKLYPLYLATADKELNKMDPNIDENLNRCAFSKACNIPWSDLNCEKYDL